MALTLAADPLVFLAGVMLGHCTMLLIVRMATHAGSAPLHVV